MFDIRNHGIGNSNNKMNIYYSPTEPPKKYGLWIKTGAKAVKTTVRVEPDNVINTFFSRYNLPSILYGTSFAAFDNTRYVYYITGDSIYKYDVQKNVATLIYKHTANIGSSVLIYLNGFLYAVGESAMYVFNTNTNKMNADVVSVPMQNSSANFVVDVANNEFHLMGSFYNSYSTAHQIYNATTGVWRAGVALPTKIYAGQAVLYNGDIYIFGGVNSSGNASNIVYYLAKDATSWTTKANIPGVKQTHSGFLYNNEFYIAGGSNNTTNDYKRYVYNFASNTWTTLTDMPTNMNSNYAFQFGDSIYYMIVGAPKVVYKYALFNTALTANTLYIFRENTTYSVEIITLKDIDRDLYFPELTFSSLKMTNESAVYDSSIETYRGDGTKWIKL